MKTKLIALLALGLSAAFAALAQGTAFTYHGWLNDGGAPANGDYDLLFSVYDAEADGLSVAGPLLVSPVTVANGLFSARVDFGAGVFTGPSRWVEIRVRPVGVGEYALLTPRQELTSSPYSIFAGSAGTVTDGTVTANQLNTGGVAPAPGQFLSYNGGNLFWSDPGIALGEVWSVNGAKAYYNGGNVGIGTANPLENLTIAGVTSFNTGLKVTGSSINGTGLAPALMEAPGRVS